MVTDSGEGFTIEVSGAFDDVEDISAVPTPITPACDGYPPGAHTTAFLLTQPPTTLSRAVGQKGGRASKLDRAHVIGYATDPGFSA
jgi:hypothetical protein